MRAACAAARLLYYFVVLCARLARPRDYCRTVITFPPYQVRGCVQVQVLNDCVMEADEEFHIVLDGYHLSGRFIIDPDQAEVLITDNNGT